MSVRKEKVINAKGHKFDTHVEIYNSAEEVVNDCKSRPVRISGYALDKRDFRKSWEGVSSYDEALSLMRDGYQPVVKAFSEELKVAPREGKRISFNNNIQGFAPIVPLALKCVPTCMIDMQMKPIKAKVLDVYYDMTAGCGHNSDEFIKAGKAVLGTIIELEKRGYKFNLYAVQSYYRGDKNTVDILCVKVKSSDRPLDLKRMSFPLTHPAFFRVIGFDWQGKSPITRDIGGTRGRAVSYDYSKEVVKELMAGVLGATACYISCAKFIDDGYNTNDLKEGFTNVGKPSKK